MMSEITVPVLIGSGRSFLIVLANSQPFPGLCATELTCRTGITLPEIVLQRADEIIE